MLRSLRLLLLSVAGLASYLTPAFAGTLADPSGVWLDEDGQARIRIEHCEHPSERICGYLVWSKDGAGPTNTDDKNPDARKKGRPVLGLQLILGLAPEDEDYVGEIYNADNGKTYEVKLWREDDGHLKVKGCVLRILCKSQVWARVSDVAPGQLIGPVGGENGPRSDPEWAKLRNKVPHAKGRLLKTGAS